MAHHEHYSAVVPDWADANEFVIHEPNTIRQLGDIVVPEVPASPFLLAIATLQDGSSPKFLDCTISLVDPSGTAVASSDIDGQLVHNDPRLLIIEKPASGCWKLSSTDGKVPYAVNTMLFHPTVPRPAAPAVVPFKCKACKATAKGLAAAIAAAAGAVVLPNALVAAVAAFLGAGKAAALAFVAAVANFGIDDICTKLCQAIKLCP